jgi:calcineurin-like phosphoesterase family protein
MSNIWFTSDTHYYHANILKFTKRPFTSVEEMNQAFIDWNHANIKDEDTLYNLGDLSFGTFEQTIDVVKQLKGNLHLILGNHDQVVRKNRGAFAEYFQSIQDMRELIIDKKHKSKNIMLCHYPLRSWNGSNYGTIQLHGHLHGAMEPFGRSVDVGVDSPWITCKPEHRPFHLDEIYAWAKDRQVVKDYGD